MPNGDVIDMNEMFEPVYVPSNGGNLYEKKWLRIINEYHMESLPDGDTFTSKEVRFDTVDECIYRCKTCMEEFVRSETPKQCINEGCKGRQFEQLTKEIKEGIWKIPIWGDVCPDIMGTYMDLIALLRRTIIFSSDSHYALLALWIISTYKADCWDSVPYFIFQGLISSGKTRVLDISALAAYRAVLISSVTFPAMVRLAHFQRVTIMIDEMDTKLNKHSEEGKQMVDFLKNGYRRGSKYICADVNSQEDVVTYNNFGYKLMAGEGYVKIDDALLSRSIYIPMEQGVPEVLDLKSVEKEYQSIQTKLLNYKYKTNDPPQLDGDIDLTGRIREIYSSLIRTAQHIGMETSEILEHIEAVQQENREELKDTMEYDLLKVINDERYGQRCLEDTDAPSLLPLSEIADRMDWTDGPKSAQKVGYILKRLHLKVKKLRTGRVLLLNDEKNMEKLQYLNNRYGVIHE